MENENKSGKFEHWEAITGETINLRITENPRDLEGTTIQDQYKILQYIGGGGMGWVYKIHDLAMDEIQAIKILRPEVKEDDIGESLIKKEARRTQALSHDNIIKTFGVIDWEGILMLRMEYLDGEPLSKLLAREGRLSEERMIPVLNQILDALAYTHAKGLIHRDLKPKNIWVLPDGTLKILDFGLSYRITQSLSRTSLKFSSAGSPYYMSPEQLMGRKDQGPEVDIWAVGVILYQMTTGELPFPGPSFDMFMAQAMQAPLQQAATVNGDISANLDGVIRRCLEKDAGNRFASVDDIRNALTSGVGSDDTGDIHVKTNMDCAVRLDNRDMGETRHQEILLEDIPYGAHTVSGSTDTHAGSAGVDVNGPLTQVQLKLEQKLGSLYVKSKVGPCSVTVNGETHDCPVILNDLPVGELVLELNVEDENYPVQVHLEDTGTTTVELDDANLKEMREERARQIAEAAEAAERAEQERIEQEKREAEEKAERERQEAESRRQAQQAKERYRLEQLLVLPESTLAQLETKREQLHSFLLEARHMEDVDLKELDREMDRLGQATQQARAEAQQKAEETARIQEEIQWQQEQTPSHEPTKEEPLTSGPSTVHHSPSTPQAPQVTNHQSQVTDRGHRSSILGWIIGVVVILILGTLIGVSAYQSSQRKEGLRHEEQLWDSAKRERVREDQAWKNAQDTNTVAMYELYLMNHSNDRYASEARSAISRLERREDDAAWNIAKRANTQSSYRAYLSEYGNGRHASEARDGMKRLQRESRKVKMVSHGAKKAEPRMHKSNGQERKKESSLSTWSKQETQREYEKNLWLKALKGKSYSLFEQYDEECKVCEFVEVSETMQELYEFTDEDLPMALAKSKIEGTNLYDNLKESLDGEDPLKYFSFLNEEFMTMYGSVRKIDPAAAEVFSQKLAEIRGLLNNPEKLESDFELKVKLIGQVTDQAGIPFPGTTVILKINRKQYTTVTDANGIYEFTCKENGSCSVSFNLSGLASVLVKNGKVETNKCKVLNMVMQPSSLNETMVISKRF